MIDPVRKAQLAECLEAWNTDYLQALHQDYDEVRHLLRNDGDFPEPAGADTPIEETVIVNVFTRAGTKAAALAQHLGDFVRVIRQ